jgi:hypothetical protein
MQEVQMKISFLPLIGITFVMLSCGGGTGELIPIKPQENKQYAKIYNDKKDLPACSKSIEGALVYVKGASLFYTCVDKNWTEILLTGDKGDRGEKGDKGEMGAEGVRGINGQNGVNGTAALENIYRFELTTTASSTPYLCDTLNVGPSNVVADDGTSYCIASVNVAKFSDRSIFVSAHWISSEQYRNGWVSAWFKDSPSSQQTDILQVPTYTGASGSLSDAQRVRIIAFTRGENNSASGVPTLRFTFNKSLNNTNSPELTVPLN